MAGIDTSIDDIDDGDGAGGDADFNMQTLVRYNNPVLVVKHTDKTPSNEATTPKEKVKRVSSANAILDNKKEAEEILNTILPSREWEDESGQLWIQTVSSTPATRQDVIHLQEILDVRLQETQARETGICPIRRVLYTQCFDEIIRQVTINCIERGLLLARVKDEIAMSMQAYETLYCSSVTFGMRKALMAREENEQLQEKVKELKTDKNQLEETINDMKIKNEQSGKRYFELRVAEEKKYAEEVAFLKKTNAQLKAQLEGITISKK